MNRFRVSRKLILSATHLTSLRCDFLRLSVVYTIHCGISAKAATVPFCRSLLERIFFAKIFPSPAYPAVSSVKFTRVTEISNCSWKFRAKLALLDRHRNRLSDISLAQSDFTGHSSPRGLWNGSHRLMI